MRSTYEVHLLQGYVGLISYTIVKHCIKELLYVRIYALPHCSWQRFETVVCTVLTLSLE